MNITKVSMLMFTSNSETIRSAPMGEFEGGRFFPEINAWLAFHCNKVLLDISIGVLVKLKRVSIKFAMAQKELFATQAKV